MPPIKHAGKTETDAQAAKRREETRLLVTRELTDQQRKLVMKHIGEKTLTKAHNCFAMKRAWSIGKKYHEAKTKFHLENGYDKKFSGKPSDYEPESKLSMSNLKSGLAECNKTIESNMKERHKKKEAKASKMKEKIDKIKEQESRALESKLKEVNAKRKKEGKKPLTSLSPADKSEIKKHYKEKISMLKEKKKKR